MFMNIATKTLEESMKMTAFSYIHTNNPVIDTLLSTIFISIITYISRQIYYNENAAHNFYYNIIDNIRRCFYKKYSISFEGKHTYSISIFDGIPTISTCFSDSLKAIFEDLLTNISDNDTIYDIQEYMTSKKIKNEMDDDMYILKQQKPVLYNKELQIYAITEITKEDFNNNEKSKSMSETEKISITLYSYHSNVNTIRNFVNSIKTKYLKNIETSRHNKQFIYSLQKTSFDENTCECWNEYLFESTRTFDNMFFENKMDILKKITFFLENKEWYYKNGIPYTLGIGLYGPPGTGKTSFFKSLANLTGRHLVILSLKMIKTRNQLEAFFYENKYNRKNKRIGFDKKIIIIEDIDCMNDIVLNREKKTTVLDMDEKTKADKYVMETAMQKLLERDVSKLDVHTTTTKSHEDHITLDDILNLWDGLKETPGRILGISSNHYDKLDPALIRPGRIDMSICLNNCSHEILHQMYEHYYLKTIPDKTLKKIKPYFYSPAEIINCYILYKDNSSKFIERLLQNTKFYNTNTANQGGTVAV
uniref:AAA+ ATPase domain-containing protein n=1 Tax=viral metagenome TaxID=1070528 RepID=A0A6C0H1K8_9ZZZZ